MPPEVPAVEKSVKSRKPLLSWKFWLGLFLSGLMLYLALHKVNVREFSDALQQVNYLFFIPIVFLTIFSLWLRALRWGVLIRPLKKIGIGSLFSATMIGFMCNNLLPARLGELARAYALGRKEKIKASSAFATVVLARTFDGLIILLTFGFVVLLAPMSFPSWLNSGAYVALAVYLLVTAFMLFVRHQNRQTRIIMHRLFSPLPEKARVKAVGLMDSFTDGLEILHSLSGLLLASAISAAVWMPVALSYYLLLQAFSIQLPLYAPLILVIIISLGLMIPSAPGYLGTLHYASILGLTLFAVPKSTAFSFALLLHASQFIPVTALGLVYLFKEGLSFSSLRASSRVLP